MENLKRTTVSIKYIEPTLNVEACGTIELSKQIDNQNVKGNEAQSVKVNNILRL